jgi:putative PEP-CTERM system histidine kinase
MPSWLTTTVLLHGGCALLYVLLAGFVLVRSRFSRSGVLLAGVCAVTAAWAAAVALLPFAPVVRLPLGPIAAILDLLRPAAWCGFILHLYQRAILGRKQRGQTLVLIGLVVVLVVAVMGVLLGRDVASGTLSLWLVWVVGRLGLAICSVLLIENLYLNTPEDTRWHVNLPCIAFGALSVYDIALSGDALLFRYLSPVLFDGRALAVMFVAPLLAMTAVRNRRNWAVKLTVSRAAVFHSATLVVSGVFLLGLVAAGQAFRYIGADWGGVAEVSLVFAGLVTITVLLTSRSARSRLRAVLVDHFFSQRYDYRREWMRCIATLSAPDGYVALHTRVIRAVAEIVDSPGGLLFVREAGDEAFQWAGSWNMPAATEPVMSDHALLAAFRKGDWIVKLDEIEGGLLGAWLAVPLNHGGQLIGFILLAPARAPFRLDREAFDLLRVVGRQVAAYVAEQRATEILLQTRQLHEYGKRFAFVAHDIKNVSSQLSLLLSNAEVHLGNPEFQRDMLTTIRASVQKISALIKRLQVPENEVVHAVIMPGERLEAIAEQTRRLRGARLLLEVDGQDTGVAMPSQAFDAVVTHLLDNAIEASRPDTDIRIRLRHEARRAMVDIIDEGTGMTPEFVRDELFRPFRTSKSGGSGIGAYQARELLRGAGGDLLVMSRPGSGTTMRLLLPMVEGAARMADRLSA